MRATDAAAARARARVGGLSTRSVVLGGLVIACVLLLILPVSTYMRQRGQIEQVQEQIAQKQESIAELSDQNDLLDDPAYIKAQARERLNYIEPGERMYVVANNDPASDAVAEQVAQDEAALKENQSAAQGLADSIADADGS